MAAVKKPDSEYNRRFIHRWYSRTFHTPLHDVMGLDPEDVLVAYFESNYEEMLEKENGEELWETELDFLLETTEDLIRKDRDWQATEVDSVRYQKLVAAQEAAKKAREAAEGKKPETPKYAGLIPSAPKHRVPESTLPKPKSIPPEDHVSVEFVDNVTMEQILDAPSVGPRNPPPRRGKKPAQSK